MTELPEKNKTSLKTQVIRVLDQYLLGYISARDVINASVPLLMLSAHKRGRKNYIEKILTEIASKPEEELTRDYIYDIREFILGETAIKEKDRKKVLRRSLKKLIERYLFDEIDFSYFLSTLYDMMCDFYQEIENEETIKNFFDAIVAQTRPLMKTIASPSSAGINEEKVSAFIANYYNDTFKSLWDEKE